MLKPPRDSVTHQQANGIWPRLSKHIANWVTNPQQRRIIYIAFGVLAAVALFGTSRIVVDNSVKAFFQKTAR
ncbi:MAG: hypothetical protein HC848_01985 [Limnobacter sp.]|nr:hypothetical protein [Limnobacter sp.]